MVMCAGMIIVRSITAEGGGGGGDRGQKEEFVRIHREVHLTKKMREKERERSSEEVKCGREKEEASGADVRRKGEWG